MHAGQMSYALKQPISLIEAESSPVFKFLVKWVLFESCSLPVTLTLCDYFLLQTWKKIYILYSNSMISYCYMLVLKIVSEGIIA